jgi:hypothetical protein
MKNRSLQIHPKRILRRELFKALLTIILIWLGQSLFAQSVGINTTNPDPSASLEVAGTNKGLLIPRVSLQSLNDKATIPNPATALLVYNTNAGLGKVGFYYNSGTAASPAWSLMGAGAATLTLPFSQLGTNSGPLFLINNNDANAGSIAISGLAANAVGVRGATLSGTGVVGHTASNGKGITASAANVNGTALEVNGRMQIHGPGQTIGAGKVLTSDANGFATWDGSIAFSASGVVGGGSENLPENTAVIVRFLSEDYDLANSYSGSNGAPHSTFTVPKNGIYHFDVQLGLNASDKLALFNLELIRSRGGNVTSLIQSIKTNWYPDSESISLSKDCTLQVGDQISVRILQQGYSNVFIKMAAAESFFNGHLVIRE